MHATISGHNRYAEKGLMVNLNVAAPNREIIIPIKTFPKVFAKSVPKRIESIRMHAVLEMY